MKDKQFIDALAEVDDSTTLLAGNVSLPTNIVGNAHTILTGVTVGTSAGVMIDTNDASRPARVNSDIVFRLANTSLDNGHIDIVAFKERLALCRGQISAILASRFDPEMVIVIKGNEPLEIKYHPKHRSIIYASNPAHLDIALPPETGWQKIATQQMSIMTFHCDDLLGFDVEPFELAGR